MSEQRVRHFQNQRGEVVSISNANAKAWHDLYSDDVEVKVVPLDAIVIAGPLPEVKRLGELTFAIGGKTYSFEAATAEKAEEYVADWAAIAASLREHPPVDEAQVKALADVLREETVYVQPGVVARRLVKRGVRVERT